MIDLALYRYRIGVFRHKQPKGSTKVSMSGNCVTSHRFMSIIKFLSLSLLYLYFILCMLGTSIGMLLECKLRHFALSRFHRITDMEMIHMHLTHIKILSTMLIGFLMVRDCIIYKHFGCFIGLVSKLLHEAPKFHQSDGFSHNVLSYSKNFVSKYALWTFLLNSCLIVIVNPSLLNPGPVNSLKVAAFNCQGLIPFKDLDSDHPTLDVTKMFEINSYLELQKPDILMLNETWLKKSIKKSELFSIDSYKTFRLDRSTNSHPIDPNNPTKFRRNGGGVLIAIRRDLDITSTKLEFKCAGEVLGITLKFSDGKKIILCSYYRVGTLGINNHNEFRDYIKKARSRRGVKGIIITGDLNLPKVNWESYSSTEGTDQLFLETFSNFELEQLINEPTHIRGNLLDLLLTDKSSLISGITVSDTILPCKSDHFCLTFCIKSKFRRMKTPKRDVYNYKRADWTAINLGLNAIDWENELNGNIHDSWCSFKNILFSLLDKHIPKIKIGGISQPSWFDAETHHLCREKERLHEKYKGTEDPELRLNRYLKLSMARKKFKEVVSKKMEESFEDKDDSGLITKKFWSYVKATANSTRIPELVHLDNSFKSKPLDQAELFNKFFYDQFSEPSLYDTNVDHSNSQDFFIDFNASRVFSILSDLNPNKALGPDKIHGLVLKNCARKISKPLSLLFTKSYYSGDIPDEWKLALVVPVHKKGSKSDVTNYRPISLTCIIMKVMEKIVRDEIMTRCGHMIDHRQHGFLQNKSCTTQLVDFCDSLALSLNNNIRSDVIYFDFAKAFDSVNHDLILLKLKSFFSIDSLLLQFIMSYLKGRKQAVVVGGSTSSFLPVLSGVPQGSILGPTLFVLFLNDITSGLDSKTNITMYADDTKIWRQMAGYNDHLQLQKDIDFLLDWSIRNKMKFHPSKCKVLMISRFNPPLVDELPCIQYFYYLGNSLLNYTDSEKDLGIMMNRTQNFTEHTNFLYSRANQRFGLLKRTCHFIDSAAKRRILYLTMVRSIFEHCPVVWRPSSISSVNKLESIQKRAIKWINQDLSNVSYSSDKLLYFTHCKQLSILPVQYRFDFHDLKLFHLIVHKFSSIKLPTYLHFYNGSSRLRFTHLDHLSLITDTVPTGARSSESKRGFANSYFYRTHLSWNRLPLSLREIIRPSEFKCKLLQFIWEEFVNSTPDTELEDDH